jgi:tetraacyldisaccharide 4'-kinase
LYRIGILETRKLPRLVISIGNIAVGGTGKTPVTAHLARLIMAQGLKVAVLSRGYGGTLEGQTAIVSDGREITLSADQCGDEPFLLAKSVPGLAVVIGSDRYAAGQLALKGFDTDIFLLDDGFQHLRLHRDLNILLLDCSRPFGNGWDCLLNGPIWLS